MLSVQINEQEVKELLKEKLAEAVKKADSELVFWDTKELLKRTCMSWNTVQDLFFFDKRFKKYKIGGKWYFPSRDTREFLENWIVEQKGVS